MDTPHSRILLLMGVAGSGKTTIGKLLHAQTEWPFYDGDNFHPETNVEKIRQGIPLTDEDRVPWLLALRKEISGFLEQDKHAIFACSALKESYREILRRDDKRIHLIYLKGSMDEIRSRMNQPSDPDMPKESLESQFEALEEPEDAVVYHVDQAPDQIVGDIMLTIVKKNLS